MIFLTQDILIDCGKAVTSINLNPITPYHLGIGCEDSTVRVFDRRALSSSSSNKMNGMFCQFRPDSLNGRTCRVTSLNYRCVLNCSTWVLDVTGRWWMPLLREIHTCRTGYFCTNTVYALRTYWLGGIYLVFGFCDVSKKHLRWCP